ncbi:hypothetical protein ACPROK_06640 [Glutamicibacter soli]|uniref:hypothetical protein n=1 Tax=Glutamicibacter soli TaxID=453836 RepID=UPI003C725705
MSISIPFLTAGEFYDRVSPVRAVRALRDTLRAGFDPAEDHQRISSRLGSGEFLLMPSEAGAIAGIKVLSVAPGNPARDLPRIQGTYILFDSETLTPRQLIDGVALTNVRPAAVRWPPSRMPCWSATARCAWCSTAQGSRACPTC